MTALSRRAFGRTAFAGLAAAAASDLPGRAAAAPARTALAAIARIRVGRFEVTFLSDGFIDLPFALFTGAPPEAVEAAVAGRFAARPGGVRAGFTVWLVRDGDRLVLVDSGANGAFGPTSGRLRAALAAIGVHPRDIGAALVTHAHVDHVNGLLAGGKAAFPGADLWLHRADLAYFTDPARAAAAPDILKSSFAATAEVARHYSRLQAFDLPAGRSRQVAPGIELVDLAGHTPGHTGVRIADGAESLILVGDMLFHPAAHPAHPGIGIVFEADKPAADAARAAFYPRAAEERALIAATHMPFPGLGRIVKDAGGLDWLPADWEYSA